MMFALVDHPVKVYQDNFSPAKGNALQACVASLFDQALSKVPNFIQLDCGYEQGIRDFVEARSDLSMTKKAAADCCRSDRGKLCIVRGKSPRGDFGHVVVARVEDNGAFQLIHDPHPDNTFLDDDKAYGWYMVFLSKT